MTSTALSFMVEVCIKLVCYPTTLPQQGRCGLHLRSSYTDKTFILIFVVCVIYKLVFLLLGRDLFIDPYVKGHIYILLISY